MAAAARGKSSGLMFSAISKLPSNVLPTKADVVRYFNDVRFNLMVG